MAAMTINDRADFECQCTAENNRVPCTTAVTECQCTAEGKLPMMAAMTINDRADFECQCTAGNNRVPCTRPLRGKGKQP